MAQKRMKGVEAEPRAVQAQEPAAPPPPQATAPATASPAAPVAPRSYVLMFPDEEIFFDLFL